MCGRCASSLDELEDGNDEWLELLASQLQEVSQRLGIVDIELAGAGAAQPRQMRAAADRFADVVAERAHVRAFRAGNAKVNVRQRQTQQSQIVNMNKARLAFDGLAFAGGVVQR